MTENATTTNAGTAVAANITSLSAARREQAAMRKAAKESHPAGTDEPTEKPAAKKSPAKTSATKKDAEPAVTSASPAKLRWSKVDDTDAAVGVAGDVTYELLPSDDKWKCVVRKGKAATVLADGVSRSRAYGIAVAHYRTGEVPAVKTASA